jgi:transcriptional regulator with XRE-family HTH domain
MLTKDSLGAVLRVLRSVRNLKVDDFVGRVDPTHVNNLENGKYSASIDTLESLADVLNVHPLSLLLLSSSLGKDETPEDLLAEIKQELRQLRNLGVVDAFNAQFVDGKLAVRKAGHQVSEERVAAVLACKAKGMSPGETARELGIPGTTVRRDWLKG